MNDSVLTRFCLAVKLVIAASLLSGCAAFNLDSPDAKSNWLKAAAVAFVGGGAFWASLDDDECLLCRPPPPPPPAMDLENPGTVIRIGDGEFSFQTADGEDLNILQVDPSPRITADSSDDSLDNLAYGFFSDDGANPLDRAGIVNFGAEEPTLPTDPILPGNNPDDDTIDRVNVGQNAESLIYGKGRRDLLTRFAVAVNFADTATVELGTINTFDGNFGGTIPGDFCDGVSDGSGGTVCAEPTIPGASPGVNAFFVNGVRVFGTAGDTFSERFDDAGNPILGVDGMPLLIRDLDPFEVGDTINVARPGAVLTAMTSTIVTAESEEDAITLSYGFFRDTETNADPISDSNNQPDGIIDERGGFPVFNLRTVGTVDFAVYQSGAIENPTPPEQAYSIETGDPSSQLLGSNEVRTFLYENAYSAIGVWLIPPTAAEGSTAAYDAAAAHRFGYETPDGQIRSSGEAVYGGFAAGDFRQITFNDDGIESVVSHFVSGYTQMDADFGNAEMSGEFGLTSFDPRAVYDDPSLAYRQLTDDELDNEDLVTGELLFTWNGGSIFNGENFGQPAGFSGGNVDEIIDSYGVLAGLVPTTDDGSVLLLQPDDPAFDPDLQPQFSLDGKFYGPGEGRFPEEVAGQMRYVLDDEAGVSHLLEVHFTGSGGPVPAGRFDPE